MVSLLSTNLLTEVSSPSASSRAERYQLNLNQSLAEASVDPGHP
jgi:hypothetical protein